MIKNADGLPEQGWLSRGRKIAFQRTITYAHGEGKKIQT